MHNAHRLCGLTCYADGSRGGQPLTAVPYSEASNRQGEEIEELVAQPMTSVTSQVMGVHEVFEPSAKVKRKHCWNTGDEDANSNREYVEGGI